LSRNSRKDPITDNGADHSLLLVCHILSILTLAGCLGNNLQIPNQPFWTWLEIPLHPLLAQWIGSYFENHTTTTFKSKPE
jgi:hypothetical protein